MYEILPRTRIVHEMLVDSLMTDESQMRSHIFLYKISSDSLSEYEKKHVFV